MPPTSEIRVARVITRMNVGGPARHVTILTTQAGGELNGVLLTGETDNREGSLLDEAVAAGSQVEKVPGLRRQLSPLHDLQALVWLFRYFRRYRPTLVATHTSKAGALGRLAAFMAGVPVRVHTFHGHVLEGYFSGPGSWGFLLAERFLASLTTHFVAISPKIADDMDRMGIGRGKTTIVRLGLQLDHLRQGRRGVLRRDLGIPESAPVVGIVGRLVPIKAHDLFLDAAELILARLPNARFVIVGDGDLWDQLHREVSRRGVEASVSLTGWRQDLADVYADLDVVVCCSRNEGTPVCLIEAGAASRPVVGTLVGGMPDIITAGVNGLLVPFGDAPSLADAVVRILETPGLAQEMGAAGQRAAFERHGAERMVADLRSLYERLLSRIQMRVTAG
jgi:glycosyltransferase involved in cell wall biosynthesis